MYVIPLFCMIDQLVLEFKNREQKVRYLSEHDELTGLLNACAVQHRIQALFGGLRQSNTVQVSIFVLDLDFLNQ